MQLLPMNIHDPMQALHDRVTRGYALMPDDQSALDAWYAARDADEIAALGSFVALDDRRALEAGVARVLDRIIETARAIQEVTLQNTRLRAEIGELQQRLRSG